VAYDAVHGAHDKPNQELLELGRRFRSRFFSTLSMSSTSLLKEVVLSFSMKMFLCDPCACRPYNSSRQA